MTEETTGESPALNFSGIESTADLPSHNDPTDQAISIIDLQATKILSYRQEACIASTLQRSILSERAGGPDQMGSFGNLHAI
jgi:hypothetical protein